LVATPCGWAMAFNDVGIGNERATLTWRAG
jgi:hypothetical protein